MPGARQPMERVARTFTGVVYLTSGIPARSLHSAAGAETARALRNRFHRRRYRRARARQTTRETKTRTRNRTHVRAGETGRGRARRSLSRANISSQIVYILLLKS